MSKFWQHKESVTKIKPHGNENADIVYTKPEDEIFHKVLILFCCSLYNVKAVCSVVSSSCFAVNKMQLSSWSFSFPLRKQLVSPDEVSI